MKQRSLRFRMMALFCAVVGLFLLCTYGIIYSIFSSELRTQLDKRLNEAGVPMVEDLADNPPDEDVFRLSLPDEYLALLDTAGNPLNMSRNWKQHPLDVGPLNFHGDQPIFRTISGAHGTLRVELIPFVLVGRPVILALAGPTRDIDAVLRNFRSMLIVLLPASLICIGAISAWYVGRSLSPISELTEQASRFAEIVSDSRHANAKPPQINVSSTDELGRLAATFNELFARVLAVVQQLRQFVSDASHELRTPLAVLQGETELLLSERRNPEEYQKNLHVIVSELRHLSRIVEGLFTLSMADAGQLRIVPQRVFINEVLEEACELAAPLARAKGIRIDHDLEEEISFLGDETFLRDLFLIFLENAVKYSPGNTTITVDLVRQDGSVLVRFADQGPGISAEHLPHIFDRFYRAAPLQHAETRSGGLGLAIARAIVTAHRGKIEVHTEPGRGSTFTVFLPVLDGQDAPAHVSVARAITAPRRGV
ncbi:MAG: HAMP domain-containing protein [Acidobacteriota bacterium]|nr:HAMP domain-containing protein [Acidobacteriota bacterium]MDE3170096.1 HAMP domain-containing protein [Acidobacteriota bacterium]